MAAGMTERSGVSMCARWLRMIPDLNGMTPAGTKRDGFSPLSPNFWRMSTSGQKENDVRGANNHHRLVYNAIIFIFIFNFV